MLPDDLFQALTAAGTVSVYVGRPGAPPAYLREPDTGHYAASTMKIAVLAALYRAADAGILDLDAPVPVTNRFGSAAAGAPPYRCRPEDDNDPLPWQREGRSAALRWLASRMIVRSSNLATNIVLGHVGLPAVAQVWSLAGATHSHTGRGIADVDARRAGITNTVTARDLAALLAAITLGAAGRHRLAGAAACRAMLDVLCAQERTEDLAAGLPPGTVLAHKNGWVDGVRHGAGLVLPGDAPPYAVVVCTSTDLADTAACDLIARVSAAAWQLRHRLPDQPAA